MGILEVFKKKSTDGSDDKGQKVVKSVKKTPKTNKTKISVENKPTKSAGVSKKNMSKLSKGDAHKVVIRPLITEKATDMSALNQYTFEVSVRTNKIEIKKAIRTLYNVNPAKVRVLNKPGNVVRRGRYTGVTKKWKKAIVTLNAGDKIEFFTGV